MNNTKIKVVFLGLCAVLATTVCTAATPVALSVGTTKTATLNADGEAVFKFTVKKGDSYTLYTTGATDSIDIYVMSSYEYSEKDEPDNFFWPGFDSESDPDGRNCRAILDGAYWEDDSPKSVTCFALVSGWEEGTRFSITLASGVISADRTGLDEDHPVSISFSEKAATKSVNMPEGVYYFKANLVAGQKYKIETKGGSEINGSLTLDIYAAGDDMDDPELQEVEISSAYNESYIIIPRSTGPHMIVLTGEDSGGIRYQNIPARKPAEHRDPDGAKLVDIKPTADADFVDEDCAPGRRNAMASGYYDQVIDERLYQFALTAGKYYAFSTEGAATNLVMEVYDADGTKLAVNCGSTDGSYDCLIGFKAPATAQYWVGVAQDMTDAEEEAEDPLGDFVTFTARLLSSDAVNTLEKDAWDPVDDELATATGLTPTPGATGDDIVAKGSVQEGHTLGLTDFADCYCLAARKGLVYKFKTVLEDGAAPGMAAFPLVGEVFTLDAKGKEVSVTTIADLSEGGSFKAGAHGNYYLRVTVGGGQGQDYGPYSIYSLATSSGTKPLGSLTVDIGGLTFAQGASWSLDVDGKTPPAYQGGSTVLLEEDTYKVSFATVKNWTSPGKKTVTVSAANPTTLSVKYSDAADPDDDVRTGSKVTELKPKESAQTVARSLWTEDAADWFKLPLTVNTRYSLSFKERTGDAEIAVYGKNGKDLIANGTDVSFLAREAKGTYYVAVLHGTAEMADSRYVMRYSSKQVGAIGFDKTALSVKDTATKVTLSVKRTDGKTGRVRARYTTMAGTAKPGIDYVPASGFLEWVSGDTKAKTITVTLVPDLVAKWQSDRAFTVALAAVAPSEVQDDEEVPVIGAAGVCEVAIQEATKMSVGTVQFAGYGAGKAEFASAKKPAASVPAGASEVFWLERIGGSDGEVGVTVTPTKGTAAADVNFDATAETLVWKDGETGMKAFTLSTLDSGAAYQADKTLTLKLSVDKTVSSYAAKLGTAVTVTVTEPKATRTFENFASSFTKASGVTAKASKDTWYFDEGGSLRNVTPKAGSKAEVTFTVTGPGKFTCRPVFENGGNAKNTLECTIGKEKVACGDGEEIVRYLGKGSTAVKFTVNRAKGDVSGDVFVRFEDQGDGAPFAWKPLPTPTLLAPVENAVVAASSAHFYWKGADDEEIVYKVYLATAKDKKKIGTAATCVSGYDEAPYETEAELCPTCGDDGLENGESYVWRVDSAFIDEEGAVVLENVNSAVWSFKTAPLGGVQAYVKGGTDADGAEIAEADEVEGGIPVTLVQGVAKTIQIGEKAGKTCTYALVKGTKLPDGLKLAEKTGVISGVPTKTGTFVAAIQAKESKTEGVSTLLRFTVVSPGLATGTFAGLLSSDNAQLGFDDDYVLSTDAASAVASLSVTATDAGKLSAKVVVGGKSYSFSGTGWSDSVAELENGLPGVTACLTNTVKLTASDKAKTKKTAVNVLKLAACRGGADDPAAIDARLTAELVLTFLSDDKTTFVTNVAYVGEAVRDGAKTAEVLAGEKPFVGYYTVSLPVENPTDGAPQGHGYLTMTLDAKGKAKVAAVLADGTSFSSSCVAGYTSSGESGGAEVLVPVYWGKGKAAFGGWLRLKLGADDVPVAASDADLVWIDADPAKTYDGASGYLLYVEPTGGYYSTIYNLQAYYLGWSLAVRDFDDYAALPSEFLDALGDDYQYVAYPGLSGLDYLVVDGNAVSMAKQSKVMRTDNKKLIDWEKTVNPSNMSVSFKRATGIYSGSFDVWAGNDFAGEETVQKKVGSFKHQGVMLLARDADASEMVFEDAVMPGFFLAPLTLKEKVGTKTVSRKWSASLPFVIAPEEIDQPWLEEDWEETFPTGVTDDDEEE